MVTFEKRAADLISLYILFLHYRPRADTQEKIPLRASRDLYW